MTYSSPSREDIKLALHNDIPVVPISARAVVLKKTLALRMALDREGCPCPLDESTALSSEEYAHAESRREFLDKALRGHCSPEASCKGWLVFGRHKDGYAYIKCEHYGSHNRHHLIDHRVQETNEEYMEALFDNDQDEVARIGQAATAEGRGPLLPCHTVANSTSMWPFCLEQELHNMLHRMHHELADATPKRFLRHPAICSQLRDLVPTANPMLSDLHISLANCDHLRVFIKKAKMEIFPCGTDWEGVKHYKESEVGEKPIDEHYVWIVHESSCPENTDQLIVSFNNLAAADVYCHEIVLKDTGSKLKWRHIHSPNVDVLVGILQWGGDQHGGQALGLGLYLADRTIEIGHKKDLHEPTRLLQDLTLYEHLHRIFRLCHVPFKRKIKGYSIPDDIKNLMHSLVCITHTDFEGTLDAICKEGGKARYDWVHDKVWCQFTFAGICWEWSFIPKDVWLAGELSMNLMEAAHADVNCEGTGCTLLGALARSEEYNWLKDQTMHIFEGSGVWHSYRVGSVSECAQKNIKRTVTSRLKGLEAMDTWIQVSNKSLSKGITRVSLCHETLAWAELDLDDLQNGRSPNEKRRGASSTEALRAAIKKA
ncbi:hypothetical protein K439DRAFT_1613111 [Ramaria rubella]|nr:hypothetical protein K439DRAFT_1613111 [Ramaria rubella]